MIAVEEPSSEVRSAAIKLSWCVYSAPARSTLRVSETNSRIVTKLRTTTSPSHVTSVAATNSVQLRPKLS